MIDFKKIVKGITLKNSGNTTKQLTLTVSDAATTSTTTTVVASQTANRTITLPDSDGTLMIGTSLAPDSVVITNSTGALSTSPVTSTQLTSLEGITGNVETRLESVENSTSTLQSEVNTLQTQVASLESDPTTKTYVDTHLGGASFDQTGIAVNDTIIWDGTKYVLEPIPASGANQSLSNLTSPTSINQDLNFADATHNIGSPSVPVNGIVVNTVSIPSAGSILASSSDILVVPTGNILVSNKQIKNVAAPTDPTDAVNKDYVDNLVADEVLWTGTFSGSATGSTSVVPIIFTTTKDTKGAYGSGTAGVYTVPEAGDYQFGIRLTPTSAPSAARRIYIQTPTGTHDVISFNTNGYIESGVVTIPNLSVGNNVYFVFQGALSVTDNFDAEAYIIKVQGSAAGTGAGVSSLNSLSGDVLLAAGSNITLTPSGNTITIAATGSGGGANQTLSNLTSPTAINQDLHFQDTSSPVTQGIYGGNSSTITTNNMIIKSGTATGNPYTGSLTIATSDSTSGIDYQGPVIVSASALNIPVHSADPAVGGGRIGGGSIYFNGTSSTIRLHNGSSWSNILSSSTGANTALSNLASTAINADLVFDGTSDRNILTPNTTSGGSTGLSIQTGSASASGQSSGPISLVTGTSSGAAGAIYCINRGFN